MKKNENKSMVVSTFSEFCLFTAGLATAAASVFLFIQHNESSEKGLVAIASGIFAIASVYVFREQLKHYNQ